MLFRSPVATAAAAQAALVLPGVAAVNHLGPALLEALAAAVSDGDSDLAVALRRVADAEAARDRDDELDQTLLRVATILAELRAAGTATATAAERILAELVAVGRPHRR